MKPALLVRLFLEENYNILKFEGVGQVTDKGYLKIVEIDKFGSEAIEVKSESGEEIIIPSKNILSLTKDD